MKGDVAQMRLWGNQVCCGSYACLNAMKDKLIDLELFEISTSTPFGIKHCQNSYFDRLLTTFRDPNQGVNDALLLWGYQTEMVRVASSQEAIEILKTWLPQQGTVVLGPVDMGSLGYHVQPYLLRRMDHYITIEYFSESEVLCTDSESICGMRIHYNQLRDWISTADVPEACGKISLRTMQKQQPIDLKVILSTTAKKAWGNLYQAEDNGQGSNAIRNCCNFLKNHDTFRWKLPLLYDLEYLCQRKRLAQLFWRLLCENNVISTIDMKFLSCATASQIELIGTVYYELRWNDCFNEKALHKVGRLERELLELMSSFQSKLQC